MHFSFFFLPENVDQRVHGTMLLSHSLTYLFLLLFYLRGKTLTRGAQMCETFYCESGQTSQISGKFSFWLLWVPKSERVRMLLYCSDGRKFKIR